jgi:hypothetical protein
VSFGRGYGTPFGGGPVEPVTNPISEVGDELPITFDFTDDPDGPLGGAWETFKVTTSGASVAAVAETSPNLYFSTRGGLGWWRYRRSPVTGNPFDEQGFAAAPTGILTSKNAEVAVAFKSPHKLLATAQNGQTQDGFTLDITVAVRASDDLTTYIGGRLRALWANGVWQTAMLEAVNAVAATPVALAAMIFPPFNEPEDVWQNRDLHELRVRIVEGKLTVTLDGAYTVSADVNPSRASNKAGLLVRSYATRGLVWTTLPCVAAFSLRSLRVLSALGGPPIIPGAIEMEAPQLPMLQLPLDELTAQGYFKRTGGRTWECVTEVTTDVLGVQRLWEPGNVVRSVEEYTSGLAPVVVDLAVLRARRERGV